MASIFKSPKYFALCGFAVFAFATGAQAQGTVKVDKVDINLAAQKTPRYSVSGPKEKRDTQKEWLEVEVEFQADEKGGDPKKEFIDALEFKFFVAMVPKGEKDAIAYTVSVNYADIPKGDTAYAAVYMSPTTLAKIFGKTASLNPKAVQVAVEIYHGGKLVGGDATTKAKTLWWNKLPAIDGKVLNKDDTPFGPLWIDRYVQTRKQS